MNCVVNHFLKQLFFFHSSAEEDTIIISFCPVISMDLSSVTRSTLHNVCWHKRNNMLLSVEKSLMHCKLFGCLWLLLTQTSVTQKQALFFWACKTEDLSFLLYKSWRVWFSHMSSPAAAVACFYTKKPQRSTFSMCTDPTRNQTHSPCSILPCHLHKQFIPQIKRMVGKRYFPDFKILYTMLLHQKPIDPFPV